MPTTPAAEGTDAPSEMDFDGLTIAYDGRILEPRRWTLAQSMWARELLDQVPPGPVLELCSGAGHIGLRAVTGLDRSLKQVDIDPVACTFAAGNAERAGMSQQVAVVCGAMDEVLEPAEAFVLIIADPPYLPTESIGDFPDDPELAVDGGTDGFALISACIDAISAHLTADGAAVLQVADLAQSAAVDRHLRENGHLRLRQETVRDCGRGALCLLRRTSGPR